MADLSKNLKGLLRRKKTVLSKLDYWRTVNSDLNQRIREERNATRHTSSKMISI